VDASALLAIVLLLVVLVLVAVVVVVLVRLAQRRRREQGLAERAHATDPMAHGPSTSEPLRLKPGDVVRFRGESPVVDWVVRGTLAMDEDGYTWKEHLLDGSTAAGELRRWLSVEQAESGLEVALWDRVPGSDLTPDANEVAHDGVAFRRDERGRARYASTGTTGAAASGEMEYADYVPAAGGDQRLSFERFSANGSWEVSTGRLLAVESVEILHS
jgi:hypothetical protein